MGVRPAVRSRTLQVGPHVLVAAYALLLFGISQNDVIAGAGAAITPARLLAGVCLLWWLTARAAGHLGLRSGPDPVRAALLCFLLVLAATHALALLQGVPAPVLAGSDRAVALLALAAGVALLACDGIRGTDPLRAVFGALVLGATVSSAVALLHFVTGLDLRSAITLPGLRQQDLGFIYLARGGLERSLGLANHPIELAGLCAAALPLALHLSRFGRAGALWRACAVLLVAGPLVSISRTGLLGLAVVAVALLPRNGWPRWVGGAALGALGLLLVAMFDVRLAGVIGDTVFNAGSDLSITTRLNDYGYVAEQLARHPVAGQGFGTYLAPPQPYLDNQYLFTAVESGLPGLLALLGLLGVPLVQLWRTWRAPGRATGGAVRARCYATPPQVGEEVRDNTWAVGTALLVCALCLGTFDALSFPQFLGLTFLLVGLAGAVRRTARLEQAPTGPGPTGKVPDV